MKSKSAKFLTLALSIMLISLFVFPAALMAGNADGLADAIDAHGYEGNFSATNNNQHGVFGSFGNITPARGPNFLMLSTGDVYLNRSGASNSTEFGGNQDHARFILGPVTIPEGINSISFVYAYMSAENPSSPFKDRFIAKISGSSMVPDGTVFAFASSQFNSPEGSLLDGTAFDGMWMQGGKASAPVKPGDTITVTFWIADWYDNEVDSAVIIDRFMLSEGEVDAVSIRTNEMTCSQVWINEDNNFEFVFDYYYASNNWVKIYDMDGNMVWETNFAYGKNNFEADLPDGMYTVKTFHDDMNMPIQEFVIGKP